MGLGLKAILKGFAPTYIKEPAHALEVLEAIAEYSQQKFAEEGVPWAPIAVVLENAVRQAREATKQ